MENNETKKEKKDITTLENQPMMESEVKTEVPKEQPKTEEEYITDERFSWLREYPGSERFEVDTAIGTFVMRETTDEVVEECKRREQALQGKTPFQNLLAVQIQEAATEELCDTDDKKYIRKKLTDRDMKELKARVSVRLKFAALQLNGLTDFLE